MHAFTIKDLENLSGIKAHTIRIWEQRYTFLKPRRTDTNIRYYSSDELKSVLNIALLNKYGYKISHIDKMQPQEIRERILQLGSQEAQLERQVNELVRYMVDMEPEGFEEVLEAHIRQRGIDKTLTQLVFPFLEKVGMLWQTNHIHPAQEHIVTHLIRQKLSVGIEQAYTPVRVNKTVLLFLPEGEFHELGLLYTWYLLKSRGVQVIYMRANLPLKDLEYVCNLKQPDLCYTHLTSVAPGFHFDKFLGQFALRCGAHRLVVSGLPVQQYDKEVPANVKFKNSLPEVMEMIATLG